MPPKINSRFLIFSSRLSFFLFILLILSLSLSLTACLLRSKATAQTNTTEAGFVASPTATLPPPPPRVEYTPVPPNTISPIIVQRFPRRGEELSPDGAVELIFDRAMNQAAIADAFTLQLAAEQPRKIQGQITWPDERTMRFTPAQPLNYATVYDVILTQVATAEDGVPLAEPFTFRFSTPGYLEVTQVVPADGTTDVETKPTITVMFNRPVVPLTSLEESKDFPQPLEFEPVLAGQGEWLNTSIYTFVPDDNLPGGVAFKARVKAGLTDVAGKTILPADFVWNFTTQPPEVVFTRPNDGQTLVPIETALQVTFSQPVDPASAEANFELYPTGLFGRGMSGKFLIQDSNLTFTPTDRLEFDTTYEVKLGTGITSPAGGKGMAEPYRFRFTTVPLPKIIRTEPENRTRDVWPRTDFTIYFNTPINPATVMEHVSMTPPLPITPTRVYTYYSPRDNSFGFDFDAKPSTDYEVRITPGIEDPYGNRTRDNLTVRFRTAPLEPNYELRVPDLVGTYDADLPVKLIVSSVNINQLNLRLYQLDPRAIVRPIWEWSDYQPQPDDLIREWEERLEAPSNEVGFHVIDLVKGGGTLAPGLYFLDTDSPDIREEGYYYNRRHLLVVSEVNLTLKAGQRDALVWATNLASGQPVAGLKIDFYNDDAQTLGSATTDADGVARLDLGKLPYRNNILAVALANGNQQQFSAVSENWARGISPYEFGLDLMYQLPEYNVHMYTDRPIYRPGQTVYFKGIVRAEDDVDYRLPDLGRVHLTVRDAAYEILLDETVDLSPSATFNGQLELAEGASLGNYIIAIDFNNQYFEHYFQVAAYRAPEFEVTVEPSVAEILRSDGFTATINVNYFFGGPLAGANVTWNLLAETYQFAPPQLGSYHFTDSDDPYTCFDCWWWYQPPVPTSLLSGSGTTDVSGQLIVAFNGEEIDRLLDTGSYRLIIEATATGPDNQAISGRSSLVAHKGEYYLGLSPQEYVADAGKETAVDLVAADWAAERVANKSIDVQIIRYQWVNTFNEYETGGGYWSYETKKELIERFTVTTDDRGEAVARFTPPIGGSYQVIAQDADTLVEPEAPENKQDEVGGLPRAKIRSSIFIWVAGKDDVSWRRENHDRLTLISDKTEYAPGETAEILIPSPFMGEHEALVTIERGRIIQHQRIRMTSNSQVYRLPITPDYAPNIYVSAVLVQGREGPQNGDAPRLASYKVGILPIDVTSSAQQFSITLTPSVEQAQPGEKVTYNLEVTDVNGQPVVAEFSLDLVDKAVLSLQPRQPDEIVEAFYGRRGLGINTASGLAVSVNRYLLELAEDLEMELDEFATAQSAGDRGDVVEERELVVAEAPAAAPAPTLEMAKGEWMAADEAVGAQPAALPPGIEIREEFSDTAFWNPLVVTNERGRAEVAVALPDNLTTWVMRGVGLTNETLVGEETVELLSTKPLLIRPVAPRFFVVDDQAQLAANISNYTADDLEVEVTLSAKGVVIDAQTAAVQTVNIPAHGETKVAWDVTVTDVPAAELIFAAVSANGQYSDAAKPRLTTGPDGSLLVLRYTAPDIVGTAGQLVDGSSRTEVVALPPNYDERRGELSVQLDPSLAAGMRDGLTYLEHYPYECTEQTVSRFLPNVLTWNALQSLGIENKELEERLPGLIEQGLNKLYVQQKPDGGWGWWASGESNVHVTSYVVFALTKADQAGIDVSATALANGQNFLLNHLQSTRQLNTTFDANRHAWVLYALAEGGRAPRDSLEDLFEAREKLSHYGRAYLALALNLTNAQTYADNIDTLLSDLNNAAILSATGAHWEESHYDWWAMNTDTRSTAIILDALARLDPDNALNPNVVRWLMVARKDGIWETTQETAWALIGLTDWMLATGELEADYEYTALLNDTELASGAATKENVQESVKLHVAVADLLADTGNLLTIARTDGNGRLYYSAHLKVYLPVEEIEPADRGIIVSRRYTLASCLEQQTEDKSVVCNDAREAKLGDVIRVDLTIIAPNDLYYVVVEDPLPAGAEAIDTGLATTSLLAMGPTLTRQESPYWWWWHWYSRSELRDEKVVLFADYLPKGTYEYSYTMRATLPGDYHVIPTLATEFYFPEVFGRSDGRLLSIGR
ncbi:MAG: Ig-like domain-containing protein [Anaerolineae bacterium]|nr:Ig-like domain-containing protein [Anaerolineae bacterium]